MSAGALLSLAGASFGATSLTWPFGRDQALYYYVAREWVRTGAVPYRDTFDQKTPGIYLVHAALIRVLGEAQWPIRLAEWVLVALMGAAAARIACDDEPAPGWLLGLGVLVANVFYFGCHSFWDTAQCEIWCSALAIFGLYAVARAPSSVAGALVGLAAGLCFLIKPPGVLLSLVPALVVAHRARRDGSLTATVSAFVVSAAAPIAIVLAWFWRADAMTDLVDVLVRLNRDYMKRDRGVDESLGIWRTVNLHHDLDPISTALHVALGVGLARGRLFRSGGARGRWLVPVALLVAALAGVYAQGKLYVYHFGLFVGPEVLVALMIARDAASALAERPPCWMRPTPVAPGLAVSAALLGLYVLSTGQLFRWARTYERSAEWVTGAIDREAFADTFTVGKLFYYYKDGEEVGLWLKEHADPSDRLLVRGFEPEIYVVSGLAYGGRFFWDDHLTNPRRTYRREAFLEQDRADLERISPRWIVALHERKDMPDWPKPKALQTPEHYEALGYRTVKELYGFSIMERTAAGEFRRADRE